MMGAADQASELQVLRELVSTLQSALAETRQQNKLLQQKVDALLRRIFGSSSERIDPAQLELMLKLAADVAVVGEPPTERKQPPATRPEKSGASASRTICRSSKR
jgi:hypothetical protein